MDCCKNDATVKKVIAVIGATGQQGGGLVKAILDDPSGGFKARALTRHPSKASSLESEGADVVKFDMDDPSTHGPALEGAFGLFVVTNYWEHFSVEKEKAQAKSIAEAAEKAGVKHIIWSTLEGTNEFFDSLEESERPNKLGDYYVPHFDGKHECDAYFPAKKTTKLYTSVYLENLAGMVQDGVLCNNMGDSPLPVIATEDIGKCAYGIFKAGHKYMGKDVYIAGDVLSCDNMMRIAWDVTGREFEYQAVDRETYASFGFPGANDLANMFYFKVKNEDFVKNRDPEKAKELNPKLQSAREWMEKHAKTMTNVAKPVPEAAPPQEVKPTLPPLEEESTPRASPNKTHVSPDIEVDNELYNGEDMWC
jgi:uncharacterized protein YbjT (DUF2867 family)